VIGIRLVKDGIDTGLSRGGEQIVGGDGSLLSDARCGGSICSSSGAAAAALLLSSKGALRFPCGANFGIRQGVTVPQIQLQLPHVVNVNEFVRQNLIHLGPLLR
jgi:hypothetical protein